MINVGLENKVADEKSTIAMIRTIREKFNRIDTLINNAGIISDSLLVTMKNADRHSVLSTNLSGAFYCTKYADKQMIKQKSGKIVNIISAVGITGNVGQANYSASKAGLMGLTKTASQELASKGITVNAVAPGYIVSDMTDTLAGAITQELLPNISVRVRGSPDDVAHRVLFLLSNQAKPDRWSFMSTAE